MASSQFSCISTASARTSRRSRGSGNPHNVCSPLDLLVQPFQHVRGFHVLVVGQRQPVIGERLLDVLLHPGAELRIFRLPFAEPGRDVAADLGQLAPVVKPAQLPQAVVIDFARHVIERIPRK